MTLLRVDDLNVTFTGEHDSRAHVVRDLSFELRSGEILGVVGESGSGKSVTAQAIVRLLPERGCQITGDIRFGGTDLVGASLRQLQSVRGQDIGYVFQEPMTALDPTYPIGKQIQEVLHAHQSIGRRAARKRVLDVLADVGIPDPSARFNAYPHQFSGGMRQRVALAIALVCEPRLLIADEPTTALDVTIQAQVLELVRSIATDRGVAVLLITHDIGLVARYCDRILAMYAGQIVESGSARSLLDDPQHPYTKALLAATPSLHPGAQRMKGIPGTVPSPSVATSGCRFANRCTHAMDICFTQAGQDVFDPEGDGSRTVRCVLATQSAAGSHVPG